MKTEKEIVEILLQSIKDKKEYIFYKDVDKKNCRRLYKPFSNISQICVNNGLPPITAIVVRADSKIPGNGFFIEFLGFDDELLKSWKRKALKEIHGTTLKEIHKTKNWDKLKEYYLI